MLRTVAAMLLTAGILTLLLDPAHDPARIQHVLAQEEAAEQAPQENGKAPESSAKPAAPKPADKRKRPQITEALARELFVEFIDTPLEDVLLSLGDQLRINVLVDWKAIEGEGIARDQPITFQADAMLAARLLDLMFRVTGVPLDFYVLDEVIVFTSRPVAARALETRVYDVTSLLTPPAAESNRHIQADELPHLVTQASPGPWKMIDGEGGEISLFHLRGKTLLVIRQNRRNHAKVAELLKIVQELQEQARENAQSDPASSPLPTAEAQLLSTLDQPGEFEFVDVPLRDVLDFLSKYLNTPIYVARHELEQSGLSLETAITLTLSHVKVQTVLDVILSPLGFGWCVEGRALLVTSKEAAQECLRTQLYDVSDLVSRNRAAAANRDDNTVPEKSPPTELESLSMLITQQTGDATCGPWIGIDGSGGIAIPFEPSILVVRQNERVHEEIRRLLSDLRRHSQPADALPQQQQPEE